MAKREKALVALMVAALAYGGFAFFSRAPELSLKQSAEAYVRTARNVTEEVARNLEDAELSPNQVHILELSTEQWQHDPFYVLSEQNGDAVENPSSGKETGELDYTGYLEVGKTRMAIINGMEYREGQALENQGGIVRRISPERVVIETPDGENVSVFYKE